MGIRRVIGGEVLSASLSGQSVLGQDKCGFQNSHKQQVLSYKTIETIHILPMAGFVSIVFQIGQRIRNIVRFDILLIFLCITVCFGCFDVSSVRKKFRAISLYLP